MKTVRKLLPCSLFDLKGIENWLEEMAAKGLIFQRFTYHRDGAVFFRGEPQAIRYRADPMGEYDDGDERKELYEEAGWTFEGSIPALFHLFSCADPEAPELHTDPQVLSYAIGKTIRQHWLWHGLPLLMVVPFYLWFLLAPQYRLNRILGDGPSFLAQVWFSALFWILFLVTARQFWLLYRARRSLANGDQPKTRVRWPRPPYVLLLLLFWGFESFLVFHDSPVYYSADMATQNWPALIQLEETGQRRGERLTSDQSYLLRNSSPLAPVQESWFETGSKLWRGAEFRSRLSAQYIQARSPALAAKVFQGLADEEDRDFLEYSDLGLPSALAVRQYTGFSEKTHPELDQFSVARFQRSYQDGFCFIARRGDQVLCVDYSGFGDLDACLDLYVNMLLTET